MFGFAHNDIVPGVGDLAEFCPACPQPGINLPVGWENNPQQQVGFMTNNSLLLIFSVTLDGDTGDPM